MDLPKQYLLQYITKRTKKENPTWQDVNELKIASEKMMMKAFETGEDSFEAFNKTMEKIKYDLKRIGLMVSFVHPEQPDLMAIGFSLVNEKAGDKFDYQLTALGGQMAVGYFEAPGFGFHIACGRAARWALNHQPVSNPYDVPSSIEKQFIKFIDRSQRYYKDKYIPGWVTQFLAYHV